MAGWLGVEYEETMLCSSWGGLAWYGDKLMSNKVHKNALDRSVLNNGWEEKLSIFDRYRLNYLLNDRLKTYKYQYKPISFLDMLVIPLLLFFPLKYELKYFTITYLRAKIKGNKFKLILQNIRYYFKRVFLFYEFYLRSLRREKIERPFLKK